MRSEIKIDDREIRRLFASGDRIARGAAFVAMNRVRRDIKPRAKKALVALTKIKPTAIGRRIRTRGANRSHPHVTIIIYSRTVTLGSVGTVKGTKAGVREAGRAWPHAFVQQGKHGRNLAFVRGREVGAKDRTTPTGAGGGGEPRLPIQAVRVAIHPEANVVVDRIVKREGKQLWDVHFPKILEAKLAGRF